MGFSPVALRWPLPAIPIAATPVQVLVTLCSNGYPVLPSHHETTENIRLGAQWGGPQGPVGALSPRVTEWSSHPTAASA